MYLEHFHESFQLLHEVLTGVLEVGEVGLQLVSVRAEGTQLCHQSGVSASLRPFLLTPANIHSVPEIQLYL